MIERLLILKMTCDVPKCGAYRELRVDVSDEDARRMMHEYSGWRRTDDGRDLCVKHS